MIEYAILCFFTQTKLWRFGKKIFVLLRKLTVNWIGENSNTIKTLLMSDDFPNLTS